jgi:hypothetical protein
LFTHDAEHSSKRVFNRTASSLATDLIFKTKTAKKVATKKSLEGVQAPGREAIVWCSEGLGFRGLGFGFGFRV